MKTLENYQDIGSFLRERLQNIETEPRVYDYGIVQSYGDGVARATGLQNRRYGELLEFENNVYGMALDLVELDGVGAVLLTDADISAGSQVAGTGRVVEVPVGPALIGRVIDPIGRPLDGLPLHPSKYRPIEQSAPKIIDRQQVNRPLETGLISIDSMIPIGRGQRELIIGDRQTGKTQIAVDAILNQAGKNLICVYCAIGQKASTIAQIVETLHEADALKYSIVVASTASDCAAMQYIAPYAACSIAEEFMYSGRDVLIVYDDLSKHAVAYRTMSLLLHRPPGREAYPGDVFYLHSRLLERAACLSKELGGGSITALPIVETMAGDISAYIPTNVISITDGQIFLESELFNSGVRPAINVGLSVSRVGRSAQHKAMREVSGTLRISLAQYRELAIFAQFGSDIDASTKRMLERGERLTETLKQNKKHPLKLSEQVALLLAYHEHVLDKIPTSEVTKFNLKLLKALRVECLAAMLDIDESSDLKDATRATLISFITDFANRGEENAEPQ